MSLKRFCDYCDAEIPVSERFYNVHLDVKTDKHGDAPIATADRDFCYACTKKGKALVHLMERYEASLRPKQEPAPPTVGWGDTREKSE